MNTKQIHKAVKTLVPRKCTLPILENVLLDGEHLTATDLQVSMRIPYKSIGRVVFPAQRFLRLLETTKSFEVRAGENQAILVHTDENEDIKLIGEEEKEWPSTPWDANKKLSNLSLNDLEKLNRAVRFVSTDELRPAMCCIMWRESIVGTDGHRMYFEKAENPQKREVLILAKTLALLNCFGGEWEMMMKTEERTPQAMEFLNAEGIIIRQRWVDENYPRWEAVIPNEFPHTLKTNREEMTRTIKRACDYTSSTTHQIRLSVNGKLEISAEDVDFGGDYRRSINCEHIGENIEIGFNALYLLNILNEIEAETVSMQIKSPKSASLFEGKYLVMPMSLNG